METIELAVERMRRPLKADGSARVAPARPAPAAQSPQVPAAHAFRAQLAEAQLPIKTRVLCEYSPDVQAIVSGTAARPPKAVHLPFAIVASVIAGMFGAAGMAAAMWYSSHSGSAPLAQSVPAAAPAAVLQAPAISVPRVEPVATAAVAAATVAAPVVAAPVAAPDSAPARELVDAWAKAWSARDVERYLGFYSAGFVPDKGVARAAWESGRRKRLASQRVIQVAVRDVNVEMQGADRASVRFVQDYSADSYREMATPKKLSLVREAGVWRIVAEAAG